MADIEKSLKNIDVKNNRSLQKEKRLLAFLPVVMTLISPLFYTTALYAQGLAQTTFPPPIFYQLRNEPSYAITIPYSSTGKSSFDPIDVSIPIGMTVIWFNDDHVYHTVTTISNSTYSSPVKFDSNFIPSNGGSYIHSFTKPGIYEYYDKFNPSVHARISVGTAFETGKNINMMIGGKIPLNISQSQRTVLSFIPKNIAIPPANAITYEVTILNLAGRPVFSHRYDDTDGILDLEIIPTHRYNSSQFLTWGPDFRSQEAVQSTGTFHIQGPLLVENSPYSIRVAIIAKDNSVLSNPVVDTFTLFPKVNLSSKNHSYIC
jgi:plastocyanin